MIVVAATLGGCGGGDGATGATAEPFDLWAVTTIDTNSALTQARYLARANWICRHGWREVLSNFADYSSWQRPELTKKQAFVKSIQLSFYAGVSFHLFDKLQLLGAPPGRKHQVEEVIGAMQTAAERGSRLLHLTTADAVTALFADYNQLARDYGLQDCMVDGTRLVKAHATRHAR